MPNEPNLLNYRQRRALQRLVPDQPPRPGAAWDLIGICILVVFGLGIMGALFAFLKP